MSQESPANIHFSLLGQDGATRPPRAAREALLNMTTVRKKRYAWGGQFIWPATSGASPMPTLGTAAENRQHLEGGRQVQEGEWSAKGGLRLPFGADGLICLCWECSQYSLSCQLSLGITSAKSPSPFPGQPSPTASSLHDSVRPSQPRAARGVSWGLCWDCTAA